MSELRTKEPMPMREFLEAMAKDLERGAISPWLTLKDHRGACADWVRNIRQQLAEHGLVDLDEILKPAEGTHFWDGRFGDTP